MLPLLYTRQFLMERWKAKRSKSSQSMIYSAENNLYAVRRIDTAVPPEKRSTLIFDCDLIHGDRQQKIFMGLMETASLNMTCRSPGIGVSIDLLTGLVIDLLNDQGVLGYLEDVPQAGVSVHVRVEVDIIGRVYLPKIIVGENVILHPALYLDAHDQISAVVGTSVHPLGDARFENTRLRVEEANPEVLTPVA